ncbi:MAG TPA: hypothetical protein VEK08_25295 [Planctomycetota bacterium]|nr:hypothetical protein [Planctomycetota bacterium]
MTHAGKVTAQLAEEIALKQFGLFEERRREVEATQPTSDFDKAIEALDLKKLPKPKRRKKSDDGSSPGKK